MSEQDKIWVGKGKEFGSYGAINLTLDLETLQQHAFVYKDKTYVRINIQKMREPDRYGKTHSASIDTWKPHEKDEEVQYDKDIPE